MVVKAPDDLPAIKGAGDLELVALDLVPVVFFDRLKGVVGVDQLNDHSIWHVQAILDGLELYAAVAVDKTDVVLPGFVVFVRHHVHVIRLGWIQTNTGGGYDVQGQLLHVHIGPYHRGRILIFFLHQPALLGLLQRLIKGDEVVLRQAALVASKRRCIYSTGELLGDSGHETR